MKTREQYREYMRQYREKNKGQSPEKIYGSPAWAQLNPEKALFFRMRTNAAKRGHALEMTFDEFLEEIGGAIPETCPILGIPLSRGRGQKDWNSPSVDRVDSTKPYRRGNIAVISYRANVIKSFGTASEHRAIADFIDRHKENTSGT